MKYTKKPVTIEAFQFGGSSSDIMKIEVWINGGDCPDYDGWSTSDCGRTMIIKTLEGEHIASPGDFIIKGVAGEFYPCKPDIFEKTYSPELIKAKIV